MPLASSYQNVVTILLRCLLPTICLYSIVHFFYYSHLFPISTSSFIFVSVNSLATVLCWRPSPLLTCVFIFFSTHYFEFNVPDQLTTVFSSRLTYTFRDENKQLPSSTTFFSPPSLSTQTNTSSLSIPLKQTPPTSLSSPLR